MLSSILSEIWLKLLSITDALAINLMNPDWNVSVSV